MLSAEDNDVGLASLGAHCLAKIKVVNEVASLMGISVTDVHLYVALGSINLQRLNEEMITVLPVTPLQFAKALNINAKKAARFATAGTAKGLLVRERGGTYRVADPNQWFSVAKQLV